MASRMVADVYAWGSFRDASGLWCFTPGTKIQSRPTLVLPAATASSPVQELASGADHLLARTAAGTVWSWGCGERGRLGRLPKEQTEGRKDGGVHATALLTPAKVRTHHHPLFATLTAAAHSQGRWATAVRSSTPLSTDEDECVCGCMGVCGRGGWGAGGG